MSVQHQPPGATRGSTQACGYAEASNRMAYRCGSSIGGKNARAACLPNQTRVHTCHLVGTFQATLSARSQQPNAPLRQLYVPRTGAAPSW